MKMFCTGIAMTLLYPQHADLLEEEGVLANHRINGLERQPETATVDISIAGKEVECLGKLVQPFLQQLDEA